MEHWLFAVEEVVGRSLHQSLSAVTFLNFQDGIYLETLSKGRQSQGLMLRCSSRDKKHWERQVGLWISLMEGLAWGKPQGEVTPGHMTYATYP